MKKIFTLLAVAALLAVSCQKEGASVENGGRAASGKLTASFVQTKVDYAETPELNLQPAWEVGDQIIGFDDANNTYTLTVASVSAETATLEGNVPDGALHLIYKSGANASDIKEGVLTVSYRDQAGDKTIPAVMLSDGTVKNGSGNFNFSNAGAIIGINAVKGAPSGSIIDKVQIVGNYLSSAEVSLNNEGNLALTAKSSLSSRYTETVSTVNLDGITVNADGTLSSPVFFAVPVGAKIQRIAVGNYSYTISSTRTVKAGQYLYVKDQAFKPAYFVHYLDCDYYTRIADDDIGEFEEIKPDVVVSVKRGNQFYPEFRKDSYYVYRCDDEYLDRKATTINKSITAVGQHIYVFYQKQGKA